MKKISNMLPIMQIVGIRKELFHPSTYESYSI